MIPNDTYFLLHDLHMITLLNIMTEQKGKGCQGIRTIKTMEYQNTRKDFKCWDYWEQWKTTCQTNHARQQRALSDKVTLDIDGFTDRPVIQCDVRVVKKYFCIDYSK